jgi:hypothetical protein
MVIFIDDTTNIHPDQGPNNYNGLQGWTKPENRVLVGCVFIEIVTESETCHIYKTVLLIIKVVSRNVSKGQKRTQAPKSNPQHTTAILYIALLLLERA